MELEVLPAAKGDCLLLHSHEAGSPRLILIDGGPSGVYGQTLRPRLLAIRDARIAQGEIGPDDPLVIDLVLISHVDDDHINGIKALLTDIKDRNAPFKILRIWHNGFDSLAGLTEGAGLVPEPGTVTASLAAEQPPSFTGPNADVERDLWKVLASIGQGVDVLKLAQSLKIPVNPEFGGNVILAGATPIDVHGLRVTVLGPRKPELEALRAKFRTWLEKGAQPASLTADFSDDSVPNLSSIVLLVETGYKRLLLTGDARGDKIQAAAGELGLLDADGRLPLTIHKVPHHGSDRNVDTSYFAMFPARRFIFSGNGEHGNPERKTLSFLAEALDGAAATVQLTYAPAIIDAGREAEWRKHHATPFDHPSQGLVAFFAAQPNLRVIASA